MNAAPEFKAAARARMQRLNADPELTARRNAAASKRMKRLRADPEFRGGTQRAHEAAATPIRSSRRRNARACRSSTPIPNSGRGSARV